MFLLLYRVKTYSGQFSGREQAYFCYSSSAVVRTQDVGWTLPTLHEEAFSKLVQFTDVQYRTSGCNSSWGNTAGLGLAPGFCNRKEWWLFLDSASALRFYAPRICFAYILTWSLAVKNKALRISCIAFSCLQNLLWSLLLHCRSSNSQPNCATSYPRFAGLTL